MCTKVVYRRYLDTLPQGEWFEHLIKVRGLRSFPILG